MTRLGEFEWIERYLAPLAGEAGLGLKDDAALFQPEMGMALVITQDAIFEGVHFLTDDPLDMVARKALRVNISDVVAKGANPICYSMALGVPDRWQDTDMERFAQGLQQDQQEYGITLSGGDTYRSAEKLCVAITLFGEVTPDRFVRRSVARDGDILAVSGTIGDAAIGLKVAQGELEVPAETREEHIQNYRLPNPPLKLRALLGDHANAAMDISDGLLGDCRKLANASGLQAFVEPDHVPVSKAIGGLLERTPALLASVLTGGDDYQCLMSVPAAQFDALVDKAKQAGIAITCIGKMESGEAGKVTLGKSAHPLDLDKDSFSHF